MPRYLLMLWAGEGATPAASPRSTWARWAAPRVREGVVRATGAFGRRMATLTQHGAVTTVSERDEPGDAGAPWGFALVEAENLASAVALAASGPGALVGRVEVRPVDPSTEAAQDACPGATVGLAR